VKMEARLRQGLQEKNLVEDQLQELKYKFKNVEDNFRGTEGKLIRAEAKLSVKLSKGGDSTEAILKQLDEQDKVLHQLREQHLNLEKNLEEQISAAEAKLNEEITKAANKPKVVLPATVAGDSAFAKSNEEVNPFLLELDGTSSVSTDEIQQVSSLFSQLTS